MTRRDSGKSIPVTNPARKAANILITVACLLIIGATLIVFRRINRLRITAIVPTWLFAVLSFGIGVNILFTNLRGIAKPESADRYASLILLQYAELPLAFLLLLNVYLRAKPSWRVAVLSGGILALFAGETVAESFRIIRYTTWRPGYSPFLWLGFACAAFFFYRFVDGDWVKRDG